MASELHLAVTGPAGRLEALLDFAEERLQGLERRWSRFRDDSEVSRLNAAAGSPVTVSPDTLLLLGRAVDAWRRTGGAFDPTVLPALLAAGYVASIEDPGRVTRLPGEATAGPAPGCDGIVVDPAAGTATVPPGVAFDPGGIGKGLAADLVATELREAGAAGALVEIGGDLRVTGASPTEEGWIVVVEDPFARDGVLRTLRLSDGAVATSSTLSRTWERDGRRVHHLIDPGTGAPVAPRVVAATVLAAEGWVAETACKTLLVTDPLPALEWLDAGGLAGLVVDRDGVSWESRNLARFSA